MKKYYLDCVNLKTNVNFKNHLQADKITKIIADLLIDHK